ncbi:hypothetical protein DPMN_001636, partial [Dreissena polymorpha]
MLDHFSRYDDILNYKLCLSIIDVFGIDSYIAQTAYLRLTHSNSFPQVWRRLPITEFVDKRTFRRHRKQSRDQTIHHRRGVPYLPPPHFYIMTPADHVIQGFHCSATS